MLHVHEFRERCGMQSTLPQVVTVFPTWIRDVNDRNFGQDTDYPNTSLQSHQTDATSLVIHSHPVTPRSAVRSELVTSRLVK
jgi:hypothetical protein